MKFIYKARNKDGNNQSGEVLAVDRNKAEALLLENGLAVFSLEEQQENLFEKLNPFGKSVKNKDMVLFSRQLATLISARVPIIQALRILQEQVASKYLLSIIGDLISAVENGDSLSNAMTKHSNVFGNVYVSMVMSGEVSGSLDKSLVYLADQLEKNYALAGKVKSALTYPIFVLSALVIIGLLMFKFVLPNLTSVLEEQGGTLPPVSVMLIAFTKFFNQYWWIVLMFFAGLILFLRFYVRTAKGRYVWDSLKIHFPIIGDIFKKIYLTRFSTNLATLVVGGIPIIKALQIVAEVINNVVYRDIILDAVTKIQSGKSISEGLSGHPEFPSIVTQMVKVGEQTAQLDDIMAKLGSFYGQEVDAKVSTLTTLLEPIIMIILGIGVGILVAGILMPIYNLASTAG
ncbi:MAG TPA: type II secretion system F family protein [Candidatus Limnocylindria bacterium]|nr:type II secretion system F family protein [Candidatus Limnocylindria bacterium]